MKIAWIGTGVMGAPMAQHLAKAGHEVTAYNRTYAKAQQLEPLITAVESIQACVEHADVVFTIVGYPKDVEETYTEIFKHIQPNTICVDMTTSSPSLAKKLSEIGLEKNFYVLDAPVTGGDLGAINGTLSTMVGGDAAKYEIIKPLLETFSKTITYMGKAGNGQSTKLANQTVIAGNIAGIAEALAFAKHNDLPLEACMNVFNGGSAASWQATNNGAKMLDQDFRPGFFIKHFLKDLHLVLEEKGSLQLDIVERVTQIYERLVADGLENEGTQAIIKYYSSIK